MKYTADTLNEILPVLKETVARQKGVMLARGQALLQAVDQVTRFADLVTPFFGPRIEELTVSYLLPQVHSYLKEVSGAAATPHALRMIPAFVSGARSTRLFESMGKLFQSGEEL